MERTTNSQYVKATRNNEALDSTIIILLLQSEWIPHSLQRMYEASKDTRFVETKYITAFQL